MSYPRRHCARLCRAVSVSLLLLVGEVVWGQEHAGSEPLQTVAVGGSGELETIVDSSTVLRDIQDLDTKALYREADVVVNAAEGSENIEGEAIEILQDRGAEEAEEAEEDGATGAEVEEKEGEGEEVKQAVVPEAHEVEAGEDSEEELVVEVEQGLAQDDAGVEPAEEQEVVESEQEEQQQGGDGEQEAQEETKAEEPEEDEDEAVVEPAEDVEAIEEQSEVSPRGEGAREEKGPEPEPEAAVKEEEEAVEEAVVERLQEDAEEKAVEPEADQATEVTVAELASQEETAEGAPAQEHLPVAEVEEQDVKEVEDAADGTESEESTRAVETLEAVPVVEAVEGTCAAVADLGALESRMGELEYKLDLMERSNSDLEQKLAVAEESAREMEGELSASRQDTRQRELELEAVKLSGSGLEAEVAKAEEVGTFLKARVVDLEEELEAVMNVVRPVGGIEGVARMREEALAAASAQETGEAAARSATLEVAALQEKLEVAQAELEGAREKLSAVERREAEAIEAASELARRGEEVAQKLRKTESELLRARVPRQASIEGIVADANQLGSELMEQTAAASGEMYIMARKEADKAWAFVQPRWQLACSTVEPWVAKARVESEPHLAKAMEVSQEYWGKLDGLVTEPVTKQWLESKAVVLGLVARAMVWLDEAENSVLQQLTRAGLTDADAQRVIKYLNIAGLGVCAVLFVAYLGGPVLFLVLLPLVRRVFGIVLWLLLLPIRLILLPFWLVWWLLRNTLGRLVRRRPKKKGKAKAVSGTSERKRSGSKGVGGKSKAKK